MSRAALEVLGAHKRYGGTVALDGVSLVVEGGVFGLLGANGAGKTTLYRAILHLIELDEGEILVDGLDARCRPVEARRRLGYLPEELELYPRLTVAELLEFAAGIKSLDNAAERQELIDYWGLSSVADQQIQACSLGMRKKIGLSVALMGSPRLVLLDEPLNGLDAEAMRKLRLRLEAMTAAGSTVILSSHVMAFIERVCSRVAILRRGRIVVTGSPREVRDSTSVPESSFEDVFLEVAVGERTGSAAKRW